MKTLKLLFLFFLLITFSNVNAQGSSDSFGVEKITKEDYEKLNYRLFSLKLLDCFENDILVIKNSSGDTIRTKSDWIINKNINITNSDVGVIVNGVDTAIQNCINDSELAPALKELYEASVLLSEEGYTPVFERAKLVPRQQIDKMLEPIIAIGSNRVLTDYISAEALKEDGADEEIFHSILLTEKFSTGKDTRRVSEVVQRKYFKKTNIDTPLGKYQTERNEFWNERFLQYYEANKNLLKGKASLSKLEIKNKINNTNNQIVEAIDSTFGQWHKSINKLAENQKSFDEQRDVVITKINDLNREIEVEIGKGTPGWNEIEKLTRDIETLRKVYFQISNIINNTGADDRLKISSDETITINSYLPNLDVEGIRKIDNLENVGLKTLSSIQTMVNVAETSGMLKGEDAQRVNKFLTYATSALQIGTGIARIYCGDISGLFSVVGGIGGIVTANKPPEPSAEMKAIMALRSEILNNFAQVFSRLDQIDRKLDLINENIMKLSLQLSKYYSAMDSKLDKVLMGISDIKQYNAIENIQKISFLWDDANKSFYVQSNSFGNYLQMISHMAQPLSNTLNKVIDNDIAKGIVTDGYFSYKYTTLKDNGTTANSGIFDEQSFKGIDSLLGVFFKDRSLSNSRLKLILASEYIKDYQLSWQTDEDLCNSFQATKVGSFVDYLNPAFIIKFSDCIKYYDIYLSMLRSVPANDINQRGVFDSYNMLISYYKEKSNERNSVLVHRDAYLRYLTTAQRLILNSMAQQSLLSGNILLQPTFNLFTSDNRATNKIQLAKRTLEGNYLFAINFSNLCIWNTFVRDESGFPQDFINAYISAYSQPNEGTVKNLNSFGRMNGVFSFDIIQDKLFFKGLRIGGTQDEVILPVPDPSALRNYRLLLPNDYYNLLNSYYEIVSKYIDFTLLSKLPQSVTLEHMQKIKYSYNLFRVSDRRKEY